MLNDFERAYNEVQININDANNIEDGMLFTLFLIFEINKIVSKHTHTH